MMKVLVVLMLVCSGYAQENETLSDTQDVHAALRELTASLAETKLEVKNLRAENKEQDANQKIEVDELKKRLQEQAAKLDKQEDQPKGKQVAFSASLVVTGDGQTFGPFKEQTPLVFKHVVTNIGNAYNPVTGAFTAPLKGAYHFEWHILGSGGRTGAVLVKNSEKIFAAFESQPSGYASASNGASLLLEAGDVVSVRLHGGSTVYDDTDHLNTFSGHLLFTTQTPSLT